mgnify:CR=1 FL=1
MDPTQHAARLRRFQDRLQEAADLAFIPLSADLQYLCGVPRDIPNFGAVMHPGDWLEGAWLSPRREPVLALSRMSAEFGGLGSLQGVELRVLPDFDDPRALVKDLLAGFDLPSAPSVAIGKATLGASVSELSALLPGARFVSASALLQPLRALKSPEELEQMRAAGRVTEQAFGEVLGKLEHGMSELELVSEIDFQLRRAGALGPSFTTSLYASGPQHPLLFGDRQTSWRRALQPPVAVLLDFGAALDGYCYDYGRTVFFGEPDAAYRELFGAVMEAQGAGIRALRAGESAASADRAARALLEAAGYGAAFRHRLGHGIGLDVHEPPFLSADDPTRLEAGMLFTVEPSVTRFDTFSCRVEDVVLVGPAGGEPLTSGYRELLVVE